MRHCARSTTSGRSSRSSRASWRAWSRSGRSTTSACYWRANIAGAEREWHAEIVDQTPDRRIAWKSLTGADNGGAVLFRPVSDGRTEITLRMQYSPEGVTENVGDALGFVGRRVQGDLERFREFIEERGAATGAWRGEIHGKRVER